MCVGSDLTGQSRLSIETDIKLVNCAELTNSATPMIGAGTLALAVALNTLEHKMSTVEEIPLSPSSERTVALVYADSDESPPEEERKKPSVGAAEKPLVIVKRPGVPYSRKKKHFGQRKIIEVGLAMHASPNLLRRCFERTDGMADIVTRSDLIFRTSDTYRLNIAKEWLVNLKEETDIRPLVGDAVEGRRTEMYFKDLFPPEATKVPPTELFISCGVAPDLLKVSLPILVVCNQRKCQGQLLAEVIRETQKNGQYSREHRVVAVPCMWMRLEFEELMMYEKVREEIRRAFYKQVTDLKLTENEVWHCAIEQINAARVLVANVAAYYERLNRKKE